ncbi:hypothetical protein QTP70_001856 [Hemibagrus guttatus]|uniref:Gypsy retrotransposon integrase-like protein 1 n=1 Tax=Hemibagrus guttatus TaxID=175788 RepID=A0AAE0RIB2_9TELE|nr:hypothetical protein QTP70_001856 [Hemibagrus guttatus]
MAPILCHPDPNRPFVVEVDASSSGLGAVLSQRQGDPGRVHPCTFYSRKLTTAEVNYDVGNRELLAIKAALEEWRHWLEGARYPFQVLTDHRNLEYLHGAKRLNPRQARWALFFTQFQFTVSYRPGSKNGKADTLSRQFEVAGDSGQPDLILPAAALLAPVQWDLVDKIWRAHADEPPPAGCPSRKLFVPQQFWPLVMRWVHEAPSSRHPGTRQSTQLISRRFWWPSLGADVEGYVRQCSTCAQARTSHQRPEGQLESLPVPQSHLSVDFLTDLPDSGGFTAIMVVVDHFSKGCKLVPLKGLPTAMQTADAMFCHMFRNFCLPEDIVSDQGLQFTSQPPLFPWLGEPSSVLAVEEWYTLSQGVWERAHVRLQRAVRRQRIQANRHRHPHPAYQVGQRVWLSTRNLRLKLPCRKLSPKFIGPFEIILQVNPVAYRLRLPVSYRICPTFHTSLLKLAQSSAGESVESWNLWNSMGMVCFLPGLSLISDSARISVYLVDVSSWRMAHQLKFNPRKTELLVITDDPSPAQDLVLSLNNSMISPSATTRNLGFGFSAAVSSVSNEICITFYRKIKPTYISRRNDRVGVLEFVEQHGNGLLPTWMVAHISYADDTQLIFSFPPSDTTASARISVCLVGVSSWRTAHRLKFNPSKTELLVIPGDPSPALDLALSLNKSMISPSATARNLGVTMDDHLSFSSHAANVTRSWRFLLYNVRRIRPFLSTRATRVFVQSLVISRLDYCNSLLAGLPLNAIRPWQMIQNAAARFVFNLPEFSHTNPLLRSLHWLPVAARIRFKTLMLAYKAKNGPAPSCFKTLVTPRTAPRSLRSASTARLVPPSLRIKGVLEFVEQHGNGLLPTWMVAHISYADDTQLIFSFPPSDTTASARISVCLVGVSSWRTAHRLKFNPSKTELLVIPGDPSPALDLALSLNKSMISPSATARNLGVTMDDHLSFSSHAANVTRSWRFLLYNVRRIRPFLSTRATRVFVQSLVISRLDYCNSLLAGLPLNAIRPWQMIQNAAARFVFNLPEFSHTNPLLRSLHWLPVAARIRFKTLMLAYKAKNGPAPSCFKTLVTPRTAPRSLRSASTARLVPPSLRIKGRDWSLNPVPYAAQIPRNLRVRVGLRVRGKEMAESFGQTRRKPGTGTKKCASVRLTRLPLHQLYRRQLTVSKEGGSAASARGRMLTSIGLGVRSTVTSVGVGGRNACALGKRATLAAVGFEPTPPKRLEP